MRIFMREIKDLAGRKFGRWTVQNDSIVDKKVERYWLCRCECGTERYVRERSLLYRDSKSCGCMTRENLAKANTHELTGMTFGELTVLERVAERSRSGLIQWRCRCSCGAEYIVAGTRLVTGRATHCPNRKAHRELRKYKSADISGQRFRRLTALRPTETRDGKGSVIWLCRCDCGNEVECSYNSLVYGNMQSCGCQKKEHDALLPEMLTHVGGTSIDLIKSTKIPISNTTGYKGVYLVNGKYQARIVFQKKPYYLGYYTNIKDAAEARREAEEVLFKGTAEYYERWKQRASCDPQWAAENPVDIRVFRRNGKLYAEYTPNI